MFIKVSMADYPRKKNFLEKITELEANQIHQNLHTSQIDPSRNYM